MSALRILAGVAAIMIAIAPARIAAQGSYARRDVPAGEVTGLEMSIDGSLRAAPGGRLVWMVTVYEVLRRRDLRPARDVALAVTASYSPGPPVFTTRTDASGRAELALVIPDEPDMSAPSLIVEAVSPRGLRRTFDASIELDPRHRIGLILDRDRSPPGGSVLAIGRALDARDGRALAEASVTLHVRSGGRAQRAPLELRTDARGVFSAVIEVPRDASTLELSALTEHGSAHASVAIETFQPEPIWIRATPAQTLAAPGETIDVAIEVRDSTGAPIAGARVDWSDAPRADDEVVRTGADGRASLAWEITRRSVSSDWEDRSREIRAVHPGHGTGSGSAQLRIVRRASFVTWSVEGGALVPGLPARIYARVSAADGGAQAGRSVILAGERFAIARASAITDADGVVAFEVTLGPGEGSDDCGGPTASAATITVDGSTEPLCLPVDPDATLAVRARPDGDGVLAVEIHRRPDVARSTVVLTALVSREDGWTPIARATVAPGARSATIALGERGPGTVWVRARPVVGEGQEVRGGSTLLWLGGAPPRTNWSAEEDGANANAHEPSTQVLFAVEPARARAITGTLAAVLGPLGAAVSEGRGRLAVDGLAASQVPLDHAASAVLREGRVEPLPLPDDALSLGLLRDPWRTRARFVRGRLGSMMRAVETFVDARVPDGIDDVAVREGRGWRFNREILEAALAEAGLGDERAAALDGEPLDIDALTALDPAFTFDHVAARLTRARIFRVLGYLRTLVQDRDLDLPWARRGDPRQYPVALLEAEIPWEDEAPERSQLFDAWGHPLVLAPVRGRARFEFLQPVSGYELVSAGPDARIGTRDDLVDPFARVLPSGGVYAEAVGEDVLIARLSSVALGRATVEAIAEVFAIEAAGWEANEGIAPSSSWQGAPPPLEDDALPPAPVPAIARVIGEVRPLDPATPVAFAWDLPRERRPYVAVGIAFGDRGGIAIARRAFEAGAPVAARFDPPDAIRLGERLRIPIAIVRLADGPEARLLARASGDAIAVGVEDGAITLEARAIGAASIEIAVESEGRASWTASHRVRVLPRGALRATHDGAIASPGASLELRVPEGASAWRGRLVIGAPQALRRDPLFTERADRFAAVAAWADAISGSPIDPELLAAIERGAAPDAQALSSACALIAWSVQDERSPHAISASARIARELPSDLGARAAVLAALAPAAPAIVEARSGDPIVSAISVLREDSWRAIATERDRPTVMARLAAALLLADRGDAIGRALFERARALATPTGFDAGSDPSALAGSLALVIAARQLGEDAVADSIVPAILRRLYLAPRLGTETVFWALAASSYGALGASAPERVEVELDGERRSVVLEAGIAVIEARPGARVHVRAPSAVWARVESRAVVELGPHDGAPMIPRIEGEVGAAGERAALELLLESTSDEEIGAPVLEVSLPSAALLDEGARAALTASTALVRIEGPDRAGVVRLHLAPLRARSTHRIPLPLRWRASGEMRGLALVAYHASSPWAQTIRPARTLTVEAR